jgi:ACT domain-containing protein
MKWTEIRQKHPNKFILIGDVVEEKISETKYRILEGNILSAECGTSINK